MKWDVVITYAAYIEADNEEEAIRKAAENITCLNANDLGNLAEAHECKEDSKCK
jgi:hypothetical protein